MISGGERQLVLLARALAQEPQFMVLDEPTASLDFGNQGKVMREIRALAAAGHGVLFTTHDPNHALRAADRAYLLRDGERIAEGAVGEVLTPRAARGALSRAGRDADRYDQRASRVPAGLTSGASSPTEADGRIAPHYAGLCEYWRAPPYARDDSRGCFRKRSTITIQLRPDMTAPKDSYLIRPDPLDPRLTERVTGIDQTGQPIETR